jgi:hypothetical protein
VIKIWILIIVSTFFRASYGNNSGQWFCEGIEKAEKCREAEELIEKAGLENEPKKAGIQTDVKNSFHICEIDPENKICSQE